MNKIILTLLLLVTVSLYSVAQWTAVSNGFNGDVNTTCVYNNELYAAGNFTYDGSASNALSHIAKWNGTSWVPLGSGLDANVTSLVVFNSELYAGGDFANAGGSPALRIAKWNGSTWSAVGSGFNSTVRCLYVWNNELYAGGTFVMSGSTTIARIGKFSGTAWQAVGGGATGPVNAIVSYNNELYIGGNWFPPYVSKFNTTTLSFDDLVGSGPDNEVTSLAVFKKQVPSNVVLWIGGKFNTPSPRLCTWTQASGFATSFNNFSSAGDVNVLMATTDYLFAGGGFTATVSSNTISKLARYNGSSPWDSVGASPNNDVNAFAAFNGYLVAGGKFTSLGSPGAANRVAWRNLLLGLDELNNEVLSIDFFPNPLIKNSILKIKTKSVFLQPALEIYDFQGKMLNTDRDAVSTDPVNHDIEFRIERSGLPAGIYFYLVNSKNKNIASGKFIVE